MQQHSLIRLADRQQFAHLGAGHALAVAQGDDLALRFGQPCQGDPDPGGQRGVLGPLGR
jgi:hypothetical protein